MNIDNIKLGTRDWRSDLVSTAAESRPPADEATCAHEAAERQGVLPDLVELKLHATARIQLLYTRRRTFEELVKKRELLDLGVLGALLSKRLPKQEHRALELAVLMLSIAKSVTNNDADVVIELCNATVSSEMHYEKIGEPVLSLLVLCAIWVVETVKGSNLARVAYDLLYNIDRAGGNEHLRRYVEHLLEETGNTDEEDLYWQLRLLKGSLHRRAFEKKKLARLFRTCLALANREDNTIYVNDLVADVLVTLWPSQRFDAATLPPGTRYRFLAKLVMAGIMEDDHLRMLMEAVESGEYADKQVALCALKRLADTGMLQKKRKVVLDNLEGGGITNLLIGASALSGYSEALKYVERLYLVLLEQLAVEFVYSSEIRDRIEKNILCLSAGAQIPEETRTQVRMGYRKYFELRDTLQAMDICHRKLLDSRDQKSSVNCGGHELVDSLATVDYGVSTLLYIGTIRTELASLVGPILDKIAKITVIPEATVRFCLGVIQSGDKASLFYHQFIVLACKVFNLALEQWIRASGSYGAERHLEVDSLVLELIRTLRRMARQTGPLFLSCRSAIHVCSTVASVAVYLNTTRWNKVKGSMSKEVSRAVHQVLQYVSEEAATLASPVVGSLAHSDVDEGVTYTEEVLGYCCSAFNILCNAVVPSVEVIRKILEICWIPAHCVAIYRGLRALLGVKKLRKQVLRELVRYCLEARVHTAWDASTILALRKLVISLRGAYNRILCGTRREYLDHVSGKGWKAHRQAIRASVTSRTRVLSDLLRSLAEKLAKESEDRPAFVERPLELLDQRLCVSRALIDTKMHDCPGE